MKSTRAILAAALLTGLPVAAYSQGTHATRRRLSLHYLAA